MIRIRLYWMGFYWIMTLLNITSAFRRHTLSSHRKVFFNLLSLSSSSSSTPTTTTDQKLIALRHLMKKEGIDALIIPTTDPHMSEYLSPPFARREYLSGFTGSAGTAIVTDTTAVLFTDGRYHSQAEKELAGTSWVLMKSGLKDVPTPLDYLCQVRKEEGDRPLSPPPLITTTTSTTTEVVRDSSAGRGRGGGSGGGMVIGIDPYLHSVDAVEKMAKALKKKGNYHRLHYLSPHHLHPIDAIWTHRPAMPKGEIRDHPIIYAGQSREEKLSMMRKLMKEEEVEGVVVEEEVEEGGVVGMMILSVLDEIMWLFNIRGSDVPYNPVALSYAVLTKDRAYLFIDEEKVPPTLREELTAANVTLLPYDSLISFLQSTFSTTTSSSSSTTTTTSSATREVVKGKVWIDSNTLNMAVASAVPTVLHHKKVSPIIALKASKNEAEVEGMRRSHERDGAALVAFLADLEDRLYATSTTTSNTTSNTTEVVSGVAGGLTEVEVDALLQHYRKEFGEGYYLEPSFATIAGVNANAAIIHYRATEGNCKVLTKDDLLLLDSGGQYLDGTTDVTRTFHFGQPTAFQKEMYTRVLKGHLAIASTLFPAGTTGCHLDVLARRALWAKGRDFLHGVGHGVGAALNVHEGPQRIARVLDPVHLVAHMIVSNEPGYYQPGDFGIRIENLLHVLPATLPPPPPPAATTFYGFESLTLVPIQLKKLVELKLLTKEEVEQVDDYHRLVREKVEGRLKTERQKRWLRENTEPLLPFWYTAVTQQ